MPVSDKHRAIDNKGIELELTSVNLTGKLGWETNFIFSLNRDKISKLYGDENDKDVGNSWLLESQSALFMIFEMMGGLWTEAELYADKHTITGIPVSTNMSIRTVMVSLNKS